MREVLGLPDMHRALNSPAGKKRRVRSDRMAARATAALSLGECFWAPRKTAPDGRNRHSHLPRLENCGPRRRVEYFDKNCLRRVAFRGFTSRASSTTARYLGTQLGASADHPSPR